MPDEEIVKYAGTCSSLEEGKNGWFHIKIAVPGKQYPVKADTKLEHLINDARTVRDSGQVATWTCKEWDSENINPNSGKPYKERRLEKVEIGAPAGGTQTAPEPKHEPMHFADKDRVVARLALLKVAATIVTAIDEEPEDMTKTVMGQAQRMEAWVYRDIDPVPFE